MIKHLSSILILLVLVTVCYAATEWNKLVAVTGGSPQRFSTTIETAGYSAGQTYDELTLCNPNAATLYIGQSNVNASNGFGLAAGACKTERRAQVPVDGTQKYLFLTANGNVSVSIRSSN